VKLTHKKTLFAVIFLIGALVAVQAVFRPFGGKVTLHSSATTFDIHYPDAIIDSAAFSRLPRDMIRVPLLQTLLTQDFVDYYESGSTRLSAEGTIRRLAFEHDLDWRDEIIKRVFDEPSRVLLWRSPDGRLGYWVMVMRRNGLAKLMQAVGNVAASDSQLSQAGTLAGNVPVYALKLAVGHILLFAAKDDRLIILSKPGILFGDDGGMIAERENALATMLDDGGEEALRAYHLNSPPDGTSGHRLVVSANYLSFSYQTFFPGINALSFEFAASGKNDADASGNWKTAALIDSDRLPQHWDSADLWRALPANAAACASLPVDWAGAADLLDKLDNSDKQAISNVLRENLASPAGLCWYAKSALAAPVFVARVKPEAAKDPAALKSALSDVFSDIIGAYEAKADSEENYRRLPVKVSEPATGATLWMRPVSAWSGTAQSAGSPWSDQLSESRYFPVTLALAHGYVVFSPDARLVNDTLAVLDKRYPAIADTLAPKRLAVTVMLVTPSAAAALVEREAGRALPADRETILRNASRMHLLPKLHAVASYPPFSLSLPDAQPPSTGWVPVAWHFEPRGDAGSNAGTEAEEADADGESANADGD
jgi:uncharacterized protein YfaA (DUF2138 family)